MMKTLKTFPLIIVVITIALTACGGENIEGPPLVYLVTDSGLEDGFQGSYCWNEGRGAAICVDKIQPTFEETILLSQNEPIRFQFDEPLPDQVTMLISRELFGGAIDSENVMPSGTIEWSPMVDPGIYIIEVQTTWEQGAVSYYYKVELE